MVRLALVLTLLVAAARPAALSAQSVDAALRGVVGDAAGGRLSGATVTATGTGTGLVRVASTDDQGRYTLAALPAGTYELRAEHPGFGAQVRPAVALHVGTSLTIDWTLSVANVADSVLVVAVAPPLLETTRHTLTRVITQDEIDLLPVISRNFNDLAVVIPGVTATGVYRGLDISGSRDFQNAYQVDGVSAESLNVGEQRIAFAQDWVREFQVLTSQYTAEFGGASGGVVNAVTRSGSNVRAGRAYAFVRDGAWDATPTFAAGRTPLSQVRAGATLGGRLVADRVFFFTGAERFTSASTAIVNSAFPAANGPVPTDRAQWQAIAKLDYRASARHTLRGRYTRLRDRASGVDVGGVVTEEHGRSTSYAGDDIAGNMTSVLSGSVYNELRTAFNHTAFDSRCNFASRNPAGTWFARLHPGASFGCTPSFGRRWWREVEVIDNLSWSRGRHDVKGGVQVSFARSGGDVRMQRDGIYRFLFDMPFTLDDPDSYPISFMMFSGPTVWSSTWAAWGLFLQDSIRVTETLTLNAGVRYDLDAAYTALNSLVRTDRGLSTVRPDRDNVDPRAGVAWAPRGGRTLVRAGAGVYHDENHGSVASLLVTNSILIDQSLALNAQLPGLNPFAPDVARARRFLAEALASNSTPDAAALRGATGVTPDLEAGLQVPYAVQSSVGVATDGGRGFSASADVVWSRGRDQYVIRDVNYDRDAALAGRVVRPNPSYSAINRYGNGGRFDYRALQVQGSWRRGPAHFARLSYTWATNTSNTSTALSGAGGGATNPFDYDEDLGPADNDIRHVFSANGAVVLPLDIQIAALLTARTAVPYSATTAFQLDADPFADRPEPRNARRGDNLFSLDLRVARRLTIGGGTVSAFVEVFNLTNTTNFIRYVGQLESRQFGAPTTALDKRRVQLAARVDF